MVCVLRQLLCTLVVCIASISHGLIYAWPSSTVKLFESSNTTLNRVMTSTESSLFGSLSCFGAVVSMPFAGILLDMLGRKYCSVAAMLMHVIAWTLACFFNQVEVVLVSRFISGLGGVTPFIGPVYISEFCDKSIRGAMSSLIMVVYNVGMLISYLLGGLLEYNTMVRVCLVMSALGIVLLSLNKESPVLLMKRGQEKLAAQSIAFFRNIRPDSPEVIEEMAAIRKTLDATSNCEVTSEEEKLNPIKTAVQKPSIWKIYKNSRSTRRATVICLVLCTFSIFHGIAVIQVYAEPLFSEAVPQLSSTLCAVLFAVVNTVSGLVTAYLLEKSGRKSLMIYSSIASGLCCVLLGSQLQLHWGPHLLSAVLIYIFSFAYTAGAGTVPYVLAAEIFLPEVKSFSSMLIVEWCWLCNFVVLFIFNPLVGTIGLGSVFYVFAAVCFFTPIFCFFWLPETKGLPVDDIQLVFAPKTIDNDIS